MKLLTIAAVATLLAVPATAGTIKVTITNNSGDNGVFFTPFLTVAHNGTYNPLGTDADPNVAGNQATDGLRTLAELGGTGGAEAEAVDAADPDRIIGTVVEPTGVGSLSVGGPPVFDPGASASTILNLSGTSLTELTLLSMIIPSNDTFLSATLSLFNTAGELNLGSFALGRSSQFTGIFGDLYDAGTEINTSDGRGQAFNASEANRDPLTGGIVGDGSFDEAGTRETNGQIRVSTNNDIATFFGQTVPPFAGGFFTDSADVDFSNLITVTIEEVAPVPLPAAGWGLLAGLGGLGVMARRKKKAQQTA